MAGVDEFRLNALTDGDLLPKRRWLQARQRLGGGLEHSPSLGDLQLVVLRPERVHPRKDAPFALVESLVATGVAPCEPETDLFAGLR